jgi:preprotein translocase subunit YajC/predicted small lipoprotein YifL
MSRTIYRVITAVITLAALAGCGGNSEPQAKDLATKQAADTTAMQSQISAMQKIVTAQGLAQIQAGVNTTNADADTKATIANIITTQAAAPTTASMTDYVTAQINTVAATADAATQAKIKVVTDAANASNADTATKLAAMQTGLNGALANNATLQNQVNLLITAAAALPTTATVNSIVAGQIALALQDKASAATVQQMQADINSTNLSNAGQLSALTARLNAALSGDAAAQDQINGIMVTVAAMPTTAQIAAMIVAEVQKQTAGTASQASVDAVAATVAGHAITLAALQTALDGALDGNISLTAAVNNLIATVAANPTTAQVSAMISAAVAGKASQDSVNAILAQVVGQQAALTTVQLDLATVQASVAALQAQQANTTADVASMENSISMDEATIAGLMGQIQAISDKLAALQVRIDNSVRLTLQGDFTTNGIKSLIVSDALGVRAGAIVVVNADDAGGTINGQSGGVFLTSNSAGLVTFNLQVPAGLTGTLQVQMQTTGNIASTSIAIGQP